MNRLVKIHLATPYFIGGKRGYFTVMLITKVQNGFGSTLNENSVVNKDHFVKKIRNYSGHLPFGPGRRCCGAQILTYFIYAPVLRSSRLVLRQN